MFLNLVAAPVVLQGKVCLMQRGTGFHAEKVINCLNGGGVAAIIFARCATSLIDTYNISVHQLMQKHSCWLPDSRVSD
jgi:hypothetical protein